MGGLFLTYMPDPGNNECKLIKVRVNWTLKDLDNEFTRNYQNCVEWAIEQEVDLGQGRPVGPGTRWERIGNMFHTWTNRTTRPEIEKMIKAKVYRIGMISNNRTWRDVIGLNTISGHGAQYSFMVAQRLNGPIDIDYDRILREVTLRRNILYDGDNEIHWEEAEREVIRLTQKTHDKQERLI